MRWIDIYASPYIDGITQRIVERGIEVEKALEMFYARHRANVGYISAFCKLRSEFVKLLHDVVSFLNKTVDMSSNAGKALLKDIQNVESYLIGLKGQITVDEARAGKDGEMLNQVALIEEVAYSMILDGLTAAIEHLRRRFYAEAAREMLDRGKIIPKFVELRKIVEEEK